MSLSLISHLLQTAHLFLNTRLSSNTLIPLTPQYWCQLWKMPKVMKTSPLVRKRQSPMGITQSCHRVDHHNNRDSTRVNLFWFDALFLEA